MLTVGIILIAYTHRDHVVNELIQHSLVNLIDIPVPVSDALSSASVLIIKTHNLCYRNTLPWIGRVGL